MDLIDLSNNLIECAICFYPVIIDKYVTDCSHTFHHICLYEWCQQKKVCPLCTKDITIVPFNDETIDNTEIELRQVGTTDSNLVDNIEFQRYLEYVERQRYSREQRELENARIEEFGRQTNSTIVLINDYSELVSDNGQSNNDYELVVSNQEKTKMRIYIFLEFSTTFIITSYVSNAIQMAILTLSTTTSITYKLRFNNARFLSLVFKVLFILYCIILKQIIYYEELFILLPWIMISVVK